MNRDSRDSRHNERWQRLEASWRRWARRPPRRSSEEAARRVLARLEDGSSRSPSAVRLGPAVWRWAATAAVLLVTLGIWLLAPGLPEPGEEAGSLGATSRQESPRLSEPPVMDHGVVLLWLDAETPLYMTFAPPRDDAREQKGEES